VKLANRTAWRFAQGPGLELFLALATVLDRAAPEPGDAEAGRWLGQARRRLDRNFLRRANAIPGGPGTWLSLAAEIPYDLTGDIDSAIENVAALPSAFAEEAADILRRFHRISFAAFWRSQATAFEVRIAGLHRSLTGADWPQIVKMFRLGDRFDADIEEAVLVPTLFPSQAADYRERLDPASRSFAIAFDIGLDPVLPGTLAPRPSSVDMPRPSNDTAVQGNAVLIFRALGDATRFAIAGLIAREPLTGAELARRLGVSKPTMTHHLHQLRRAGLVVEERRGNSIVLRLDRVAVADISEIAQAEFYSQDRPTEIHRSRRRS
jgi:DNA-binding transcriptional ArsR family regulator